MRKCQLNKTKTLRREHKKGGRTEEESKRIQEKARHANRNDDKLGKNEREGNKKEIKDKRRPVTYRHWKIHLSNIL